MGNVVYELSRLISFLPAIYLSDNANVIEGTVQEWNRKKTMDSYHGHAYVLFGAGRKESPRIVVSVNVGFLKISNV